MMSNPFLRTSAHLAQQNKKALANQQRSNQIFEPYTHAVVQKREHPLAAEKVATAVIKSNEEQKKRDEYISKKLFSIDKLTADSMFQREEVKKLLTNRTTPAIDYSQEAYNQLGYTPDTLSIEYPLSERIKKFADSMRSTRGSEEHAGVRFKTTMDSNQSNFITELESIKKETPEEFKKAITRAGGQANTEFIKSMLK